MDGDDAVGVSGEGEYWGLNPFYKFRRRFQRIFFKNSAEILIIRESRSLRYLADPVLPGVQHDHRLLHPVFIEEIQKGLSCHFFELTAQIAGADPQFF